jgi:gliding-associated putative ABC transporter substrate-binding component GldG
LLKNQLGITSEERVNNSIQNLEYAFANGFNKLVFPKKRKIAVLKGNGELEDRYVADFFKTLKEYYYIAPFTLDSAKVDPIKTLTNLQRFDMIVVAQPTEAFSDTEKYILDQYTMNGGASLWLLDATEQKIDTSSGKTYAIAKDLKLNELFFKYGLRINSNLIKDVVSAPIVLASGNENDSQYNRYPWFYFPLSASDNLHPIVTNIEAVKFEYTSAIDTLPNALKKTILLSSSSITRLVGLPNEISYDIDIPKYLKVMENGPSPQEFSAGPQPLAVLLEGEFISAFANRIKPFKLSEDKKLSKLTSLVVVSDGDLIKNQFQGNRPLEVGFDKMTQTMYGNKDFLLNTVNYLLDDSGLINIRTKEITVPFLNPQKTVAERTKWQLINLFLPLGLLALFGFSFNYYRKRKYTV